MISKPEYGRTSLYSYGESLRICDYIEFGLTVTDFFTISPPLTILNASTQKAYVHLSLTAEYVCVLREYGDRGKGEQSQADFEKRKPKVLKKTVGSP